MKQTLLPWIDRAVHAPALELVVGGLMICLAFSELEHALVEDILPIGWHHGTFLVGIFLVIHSIAILLEGGQLLDSSARRSGRTQSRFRRCIESSPIHLVLGLTLALSGIGECVTALSDGRTILLLHFGFVAVGLSVIATSIVTAVQASEQLLQALRASSPPLSRFIPLLEYLNARLGCPVVRVVAGGVLIAVGLFDEVVDQSTRQAFTGDGHRSLLLMGGLQTIKSLPGAVQKFEFVERAINEMSEVSPSHRDEMEDPALFSNPRGG